MLIIHFTGLAMGLGAGFGYMFLGKASEKMEAAAGRTFMLNVSALSKMGNIGLLLLFISGGYLMTPYWSTLGSSPLLVTKLVLFLVLSALIGINSATMRKAKAADADTAAALLRKSAGVGKATLLVALAIVVLGVLVFH